MPLMNQRRAILFEFGCAEPLSISLVQYEEGPANLTNWKCKGRGCAPGISNQLPGPLPGALNPAPVLHVLE